MSDIAIAQLNATDLSESERDRARNFIAADASSPLSVFLQRVLAAASEGMSLNVLADDAELTPNQAATLLKMSRPPSTDLHRRSWRPAVPSRRHSPSRLKMKDLMDFMFAREAGAEILANALNRPTVKLTQPPTLTREDIDELNDLLISPTLQEAQSSICEGLFRCALKADRQVDVGGLRHR